MFRARSTTTMGCHNNHHAGGRMCHQNTIISDHRSLHDNASPVRQRRQRNADGDDYDYDYDDDTSTHIRQPSQLHQREEQQGEARRVETSRCNDGNSNSDETDTGLIKVAGCEQPSARFGHTSVVIGNRMLTFGGRNGTTFQDDIWAFNFKDRSWERMEALGDPERRHEKPISRAGHVCVKASESRVIVYGGGVEDGSVEGDVWELRLVEEEASAPTTSRHDKKSSDENCPTSSLPSSACWVWKALHVKSKTDTNPPQQQQQQHSLFNHHSHHHHSPPLMQPISSPFHQQQQQDLPHHHNHHHHQHQHGQQQQQQAATNGFSMPVLPLPHPFPQQQQPEHSFTAATRTAAQQATSSAILAAVAEPSPRKGHTAIFDRSTRDMVVFGGMTSVGDNGRPELCDSRLWAFNVDTQTWRPLRSVGAVPSPRTYHNAEHDPDILNMYVFGGEIANGSCSNELFVYQLQNGIWRQLSPLCSSPGSSPTLINNNNTAFPVPFQNHSHQQQQQQQHTDSSSSGQQHQLLSPLCRMCATSVYSHGNFCIFLGGDRTYLADSYEFDTVTNKWKRLKLPELGTDGRTRPTVVLHGNTLTMFAGRTPTAFMNDVRQVRLETPSLKEVCRMWLRKDDSVRRGTHDSVRNELPSRLSEYLGNDE